MITFPLAVAFLAHRQQVRRRAASSPTRLTATPAAVLSAVHATVHPLQIIPSPPTTASSGLVGRGAGIPDVPPPAFTPSPHYPPPPPFPKPFPGLFSAAAVAWGKAYNAWLHALPPAEQARIAAQAAAAAAKTKAAALAKRPPVGAMPADQNAWASLSAGMWGGLAEAYPEFGWTRTGNGKEARAMVTRGSNDWVHWYVKPGGDWTYQHDTGSGIDLSKAAQQAVSAASSAASMAGHVLDVATSPLTGALSLADQVVGQELDKLSASLPPGLARELVGALKAGAHFVAATLESQVDPTRIDWMAVADQVEAATSAVPVLGTAVSDVVATAVIVYDAIKAGNPLVAALDAAYQYALASVPGAAELHQWIDPVFNVLVDVAVKGQKPTQALITEAVNQAPATPAIGPLSPRSVAASLAAFVVSKLGLA